MYIYIYIGTCFIHMVNACEMKFTTFNIEHVAFNNSLSILLSVDSRLRRPGFKPTY